MITKNTHNRKWSCNVGGNWAIFSTDLNPREVQGQQSGPLSATQDPGILRDPLNSFASTALNGREFAYIFPKFPEIPIQAPKTPESLSLPNSPFCGLLYSPPDVPNVLNSFQHTLRPSSHASRSRHKISKGIPKSLLASTLNTELPAQFVFFHSSIIAIPFLGLLWWSGGFHWLGGRGHWLMLFRVWGGSERC